MQAPVVAVPQEVNRVLVASNLPSTMTGEKLYEIFGELGALRQIRIGSEPETKGTAFIVYEDLTDAKRAVEVLSGFRLTKTKYLQLLYFDEARHKKQAERKRRRKEQMAEFNTKQKEQQQRAEAEASADASADAAPTAE
jgi:pre-mRNA branch site protein p14